MDKSTEATKAKNRQALEISEWRRDLYCGGARRKNKDYA